MKDNVNTLKIDKFIPLLEGLQDALEELEDYPSDFELFKAHQNGKIDKEFMYSINYGRQLSRDVYKLLKDSYENY